MSYFHDPSICYSEDRISFLNACFVLQAREKFLSLKKGTKSDVAAAVEEVSAFQCTSILFLLLSEV